MLSRTFCNHQTCPKARARNLTGAHAAGHTPAPPRHRTHPLPPKNPYTAPRPNILRTFTFHLSVTVNQPLNDTQTLAPYFDTAPEADDTGFVRPHTRQGVPVGASANWRLAQGPDRIVATRASGSRVWDEHNRAYIDYVCGHGTVLLGHADPDVNAAIAAQLELGIQTGATSQREIQLADELCAAMPGMDALRFHIGTTAAVQTALKIARVATSRELIVRFAGQQHGNLPLGAAVVLPWNDADALRAAFTVHAASIAAVVAEPFMARSGGFEPAPGFLGLVRQLCSTHQAVFILNESITGLRIDFQGAIGKYLLTGNLGPDLVISGQSLGNGAPVSALAGRAQLMGLLVSNAVPHAGTFSGSSVGIAAGLAVMSRLRVRGQGLYQALHNRGRTLMAELEILGRESGVPVTARGPGPVFWLDLANTPAAIPRTDTPMREHLRYESFRLGLLDHGVRVLPGGAWYLSEAHSDTDVAVTLEAARTVLTSIGAAA